MNQIILNYRQQQGAVLVVSLIMLLIITLFGITGMQSTVLEEKMAGNMRNKSIAFQAAESALRNGEMDIDASDVSSLSFLAACTGGLCIPPASSSTPAWEDDNLVDWTGTTQTITYGDRLSATSIGTVATQPKYIIEKLNTPATTTGQRFDASASAGYSSAATKEEVYRITAKAAGGTTVASAMVQSVYKK